MQRGAQLCQIAVGGKGRDGKAHSIIYRKQRVDTDMAGKNSADPVMEAR
jgi:hypothetical protein